jgi:chromosome segregation ATPase
LYGYSLKIYAQMTLTVLSLVIAGLISTGVLFVFDRLLSTSELRAAREGREEALKEARRYNAALNDGMSALIDLAPREALQELERERHGVLEELERLKALLPEREAEREALKQTVLEHEARHRAVQESHGEEGESITRQRELLAASGELQGALRSAEAWLSGNEGGLEEEGKNRAQELRALIDALQQHLTEVHSRHEGMVNRLVTLENQYRELEKELRKLLTKQGE